ncbi:MAG: beta/gamma crystallin-related protein [Casimicrobiaceae bacterium]
MKHSLNTLIGVAGVAIAAQAAAQVTVYAREDFQGRSFTTDRNVRNLGQTAFDRRAASIVVETGNWQVCEDAGFSGRCVVLGPGQHNSLWDTGLERIASLREVDTRAAGDDRRPRSAYDNTGGAYAYGPREGERLYEAQVVSVRAVVGPPETRCWVERQQVVEQDRGNANVPGAIVGAVIGGILGHQVGGGRGKDVATAGGAVAGAAIGANVNRGSGGGTTVQDRDVQRCTDVPRDARPAFWDVTYAFRGATHRIQTAEPPGPTITVNRDGEPRG